MRIAAAILASAIAVSSLSGCAHKPVSGDGATEEPTQLVQHETSVPTQDTLETPLITFVPTDAPTAPPTQAPTEAPSEAPTEVPTEAPSEAPTSEPVTEAPRNAPTAEPDSKPDADGFYAVDWLTGVINAPYVNFRAQPSTDAVIYSELTKGTEVNVTGESPDWYRVRYQGVRGYIAKPYLTVEGQDEPVQPANPTPDPFEPVADMEAFANREVVNMRAEPSTDSDIVAELAYGTRVIITAESPEWHRVKYNGKTGYVKKPYLSYPGPGYPAPTPYPTVTPTSAPTNAPTNAPTSTPTSAPTSTPKPTNSPTPKPTNTPAPTSEPFVPMDNVPGYTNKAYVNFRSAPSTDAEIIRILTYGTEVTAIAQSSEWYRVRCAGTTGYIAKPYVTLGTLATPTPKPTASPTPTPKPTATPDPDPFVGTDNMAAWVNVERVNFRSAPNTNSNVIAVLTYGTEVRVVAQNSSWYRCTHNGRTGYIAKQYLTLGHFSQPTPTPTPTPAPNPGGQQFTDYEIHLVAALCHMEGPGSTYLGYRAIASVVYNRVMNQSGHFPDTVMGVLLQKNQFGNRPLWLFENTQPNPVAQASAEYVFRTHGSTLPPKVLFYRAVWCGIPWYDFTEYYCTIEANNYYYGILYYDIHPGNELPIMTEK